MRRPYYLIKRGEYWYFRLNRESGLVKSDGITWHTTSCKVRRDAENFIKDLLAESGYPETPVKHLSFLKYAAPFFIWDRCPHIRRLREEGKGITKHHAKIQRGRLNKHVLTDLFANKQLSEITRADVLDLRSRLLEKNAPATVNKVLGVVKVIFREALYREEINRDPTAGVGRVKYKKQEQGIFTTKELKLLFPDQGYGPWKDIQDYTCFYLAAVTGLRRGELLALKWKHINFEQSFLAVSEAWKGGSEIGPPKWDHERIVPLSIRTIDKLQQIKFKSIHIEPGDFVFCYNNGIRFGETWWRKRFCRALDKTGIDRKTRHLTPHSFRHTINTIVRNSGHDPAKIRAVLGWMDETVQDSYTHWGLNHLREWADIVDKIWKV